MRHNDDCGRHGGDQLVQKGSKNLSQDGSECPANGLRLEDVTDQ